MVGPAPQLQDVFEDPALLSLLHFRSQELKKDNFLLSPGSTRSSPSAGTQPCVQVCSIEDWLKSASRGTSAAGTRA